MKVPPIERTWYEMLLAGFRTFTSRSVMDGILAQRIREPMTESWWMRRAPVLEHFGVAQKRVGDERPTTSPR
jgi:hypothetical protein